MKALQKDRTRRYQTASDFARDIQRYLNDEPIEARRPSLFDRTTKWARRHQAVVWSAMATLILAVIGLAVSTVLIMGAYRREQEQYAAWPTGSGPALKSGRPHSATISTPPT